jgi:glycerol-3-phosphate acyltransferase PlsY
MAAGLGYVMGSLPTAEAIWRLAGGRGKDLRNVGTGNPGALNAAKVLGLQWGALLLAVDILQGMLAAGLGRKFAGDNGAYAAGAAAVVGHSASIWRGFGDGKAVATSIGTKIVCFPAYLSTDLALSGGLLIASSGRAKFATSVASACFVAAASYWYVVRRGNLWGPKATIGLPLYALTASAAVAYRFLATPHRPKPIQDARDLLDGTAKAEIAEFVGMLKGFLARAPEYSI